MKEFVSEILRAYFSKMREPEMQELNIPETLKDKKGSCFVTLYITGEVRGSAGNIKEIYPSLAEELLANTMQALTGDKRFAPLTLEESEKIQFRIDFIHERKIISEAEMNKLDPVKHGVIAIKRDYNKLAVILPNMSPKLLTGNDFTPVLLKKLSEPKFLEKEYILYNIETSQETNY